MSRLALFALLLGASAFGQIVPFHQSAWVSAAAEIRGSIPNDQWFFYNGGTNRVAFNASLSRNEYAWPFWNSGFASQLITNAGGTSAVVEAGFKSSKIAKAWAFGSHATNVLIASVETGPADFAHPELARVRWWINPATGYRGIWIAGGAAVTNEPAPPEGHATFQASSMAAAANNGVGGVGVLKDGAYIMPITIGNYGTDFGVAIEVAVTNGAKVILVSSGENKLRTTHTNGLFRAWQSNVLIIAPFSETGSSYSMDTHYPSPPAPNTNQLAVDFPSAFQWICFTNAPGVGSFMYYTNTISFGVGILFTNILSVGPMFRDGTFYAAGDWSTNYLNLIAPGRTTIVASPTNAYVFVSGTSPAAAYVAGVAARIYEQHPTWDCYQVKAKILAAVDVQSALSTKTTSSGSLNVWKAWQ